MSAQGPQKNNENVKLTPYVGPIISSPAGIHVTSPRSGNRKFVVGGIFDANGKPQEPLLPVKKKPS